VVYQDEQATRAGRPMGQAGLPEREFTRTGGFWDGMGRPPGKAGHLDGCATWICGFQEWAVNFTNNAGYPS